MSINVKARQQTIGVGPNKGQLGFILTAELYNQISTEKVIAQAHKNSGIASGALRAAWEAIGEVIEDWATEGHSVAIPGLGSMRFSVRASSSTPHSTSRSTDSRSVKYFIILQTFVVNVCVIRIFVVPLHCLNKINNNDGTNEFNRGRGRAGESHKKLPTLIPKRTPATALLRPETIRRLGRPSLTTQSPSHSGGAIKKTNVTMEITIAKETKDATVKSKLQDILLAVSWREIARTYFDHSSSWLYHKLDGIDGNGGAGGFTEKEKEQMRDALYDLSRRIRTCAEAI